MTKRFKIVLWLYLASVGGFSMVLGQGNKPQVKDYSVNETEQTFLVKWRSDLESPKYFRMRGKSVVVFDDIRVFMLHFEGTAYVSYVAALPKEAAFQSKDTLFNTYKPESDRVIIFRKKYKYKLGNLTLDKVRVVKYPPKKSSTSVEVETSILPEGFDHIIDDYHLLKITSDRAAQNFFFKGDNKIEVFDYSGEGGGLAFDLMYRHLPMDVRQVKVFVTSEYVNADSLQAVQEVLKKSSLKGERAVWVHLWPDGRAGIKIE
ncbi:MAG: hypothetical protein AAFR59_09985 [Bacteroidota bacterium]